jgi:CheY-like chemotaxis protein
MAKSHGVEKVGLQGSGGQLSSYLGGTQNIKVDSAGLDNPPARKRVLVADDEAVVRTVLKSMLTRLGYDVLLADNAGEAINIYESHYSTIDLVLFDMSLPDHTGDVLYAQLRLIDPTTRAILVTGNCESELVPEVVAAGVNGILGKPFDVAQLSDEVARALAA